MEHQPQTDWLTILIQFLEWVAGALVTAASTVVLYFARDYQKHKSMVKRHEELHKQNDKEFGENQEFRRQVREAPMGHALATELAELKAEDERLHKRVSSRNRQVSALEKLTTELKTDIKWICSRLGREDE